MRRGFIGALALAVTIIAVTGCGGSASKAKPTPTSVTTTERHADALVRSSAMAARATSFSATFHAVVQNGLTTVMEDGVMAFRAPAFDMKLTVQGQQTEILVSPPDEYISVPGKGWYSLGDALFNKEAFAQYAKNRGPIDYANVVSSLENSSQLPDEQIDGKSYAHYSGRFDIKKAMGSIPQDVLKPGVADMIGQLNLSPGTLDVWIDSSSGLPRRLSEDMTMKAAGLDMAIHMVVDYTSWNGAVDIPPVPKDAKPFSDLTGGLSIEEASYALKFSNWLLAVGRHMQSIGSLPEDNSTPTADQQAAWKKFASDFQADVSVLETMDPPDRFRPSYDKFVQAMDTFKVVIDEANKEFANAGSGDQQRAGDAATEFEKQFSDAADLFKTESKPSP